ncbi:MAG: competence/damage-inducible protein A [Clostridia bacterium]|nr:competence/damage-inducible protein A [Clostridia bacterium]
MRCELISVGTEILLGDIVNTNSQYLSKRLADLGIGVLHQSTVGDNRQRLLRALDGAFRENELVILTGGLGPTPDDLTKEVCAEYFGLPMYTDTAVAEKIKGYFEKKGLVMPESNLKQALIPEGSTVLYNNNGTAPGSIIEKDGKIAVILPGPPFEMKPMFEESVVPFLRRFSEHIILSCNVRTFGIGESAMSERVRHLLDNANPSVAPYAKSGEALLRITARAHSEKEAKGLIEPVLKEITELIGDYIYGVDVENIEEATVSLLKEKGLTVAFAESCTGGLCSKRVTDVAGASDVIHCGVVSYSNDIKNKVLGVSAEHLLKYTAVSDVVAAEMAKGIKELSGADFGVSVTGYAGPCFEGCTDEIGTIYIAVTDGESLWLKKLSTGRTDREYNRYVSASNALNEVRLCAAAYPEKRSEGMNLEFFIESR